MTSQLGLLLLSVVLLNLFQLHAEILQTNSDKYLESTPMAHAVYFSGNKRPYSENRDLDSLFRGPYALMQLFFSLPLANCECFLMRERERLLTLRFQLIPFSLPL